MAVGSESRRLLYSAASTLSHLGSFFHQQPHQHLISSQEGKRRLAAALRSPFLLLILASCLSYCPSIWGQLVFDDRPAIIENKDLRWHTPVYRLFQNDFWGTPLNKEQSHKSYRPLTVLTFRMNFWLHGLNPMGYHIINIALHSLVSFLFYLYSKALLCDSTTSLITALLFAMHPIHSDAVASIVGRAELLSALFYLTSLLIWGSTKFKMKLKLTLCISSALLGFLCKEQALTVLIICAIEDFCKKQQTTITENRIINKVNLSTLISRLSNSRKYQPRKKIKNVLTLLTAFVGFLVLRLYLMGFKLPKFNRYDNPASVAPVPTRQLTYSYLAVFNSWLILFPCDLACDWTHSSIKLVSSLRDPRLVLTGAFFLALIFLVYTALFQSKDEKLILVLSLVVVPFIPASNLFFPSGFVVAERVLYLPSIGFILLIGLGVKKILNHWKTFGPYIKVLMTIMLLAFGLKTYRRCQEWDNEYSLYSSGLEVNPQNIKLLNNVGRLYEQDGFLDKAVGFFKKAADIEPEDVRSHLNLGNVLLRLNKTREAEEAYRSATRLMEEAAKSSDQISPLHLTALLRLAELLSKDPEKRSEADQLHERILILKSDYLPAYESRGRVMLSWNRHQEAAVMLAKALEYEPSDPDALYNLGIVVNESGSPQDALQLFDKALSLDPHHEASLLASARIIQDQGLSRLDQVAIQRLNTVVEMGRADETVYFSLAMFSIRSGKLDKGKHLLEQAIRIKDNFTEALYNMALLLYNENIPQPLEAVEYLTKLLRNNSQHIKALLLLGDIYIEYFDDLNNGQMCYERILEIDANNVFAQHNLCVILVKRKEFAEAIRCFERIRNNNIASVNVDHHLKITRNLLREQLRNGSNEFKFLL